MRVAVSGASGFIGSALVPTLEAAGHDVVRLVRGRTAGSGELAWDPEAGTLEASGLAGIDGAVHLSGATIGRRWTKARKAEILDSRVTTTTLLAATLASLDPRPSVLVCAGPVGIYGDRGDEILTEESELGSGFLAGVGTAWERACEPARAAGIRVVNLRAGIVLSHEGGALGRMLTPFRLGVGGRIGSGKQWWSWIAIDDLVRAIRFALEGDLEGPVNVVSPNPVTNAQFTKAFGKALGRPTVFPFPAFAAKTVFGEMAEEALLTGQRTLPARLLDAGFEFDYPELGTALQRALEK
ncbi:MAG: TIGR01777 family oxidoreductase [Gaiellaceae bacterium]